MLFAQLLNNFSAAGRNVTENSGHTSFSDEFTNDRLGKTMRISRKGALENNASHFPVTGCRVLTIRFQSALAVAATRAVYGRHARQGTNISESQGLQIRQVQLPRFTDVPQRVRAGISPFGSIRHRANAGAVQND